jgi:hypothetical protein
MEGKKRPPVKLERPLATPGIVIRGGFEPPRQPRVLAFIWGGKVRPVPSLPYGRRSA